MLPKTGVMDKSYGSCIWKITFMEGKERELSIEFMRAFVHGQRGDEGRKRGS